MVRVVRVATARGGCTTSVPPSIDRGKKTAAHIERVAASVASHAAGQLDGLVASADELGASSSSPPRLESAACAVVLQIAQHAHCAQT